MTASGCISPPQPHSSVLKPLKRGGGGEEEEEFDRMTSKNQIICGIPPSNLKMHILEYWQRANTGLTHTQRGALTEEMLVWLAIIRPLTRWADGRYGDFLDKAT